MRKQYTADISLEACSKRFGISEASLQLYHQQGFFKVAEERDGCLFLSEQELTMLLEEIDGLRPSSSQEESPLRAQIEVERVEEVSLDASQALVDPSESAELVFLRKQLHQLLEERDWLRERLERLEQRSERDQMLMLSELDTIRVLSKERDVSQRGWRALLPWFGKGRS